MDTIGLDSILCALHFNGFEILSGKSFGSSVGLRISPQVKNVTAHKFPDEGQE